MIKFCRGETSQHIYKQVFHNFQKHQTTFCITYQTLENTICIMFWHLFGPNTFWRCWSKEPWKEIPPKQSPRRCTKDLLWFGIGRDQTTALVEGYLVWRCCKWLHPSCVHIHVHTDSFWAVRRVIARNQRRQLHYNYISKVYESQTCWRSPSLPCRRLIWSSYNIHLVTQFLKQVLRLVTPRHLTKRQQIL